jgi:hypothetical protein
MKIFGREPALWLEAIKAVVIVLALIIPSLSVDVQNAILVIATAVIALLQGVLVRPFQVPVITGFVQTVGVAIGAFGLNISPVLLAAVVVMVGALATLVSRVQVTPAADPAQGFGGPLSH